MTAITVEVPDEIVSRFESIEDIQQTMFEDFIIEQRQQGELSLEEAAKHLNLSYPEFFQLLGKKGLSFINSSKSELDQSYSDFKKKMSVNE